MIKKWDAEQKKREEDKKAQSTKNPPEKESQPPPKQPEVMQPEIKQPVQQETTPVANAPAETSAPATAAETPAAPSMVAEAPKPDNASAKEEEEKKSREKLHEKIREMARAEMDGHFSDAELNVGDEAGALIDSLRDLGEKGLEIEVPIGQIKTMFKTRDGSSVQLAYLSEASIETPYHQRNIRHITKISDELERKKKIPVCIVSYPPKEAVQNGQVNIPGVSTIKYNGLLGTDVTTPGVYPLTYLRNAQVMRGKASVIFGRKGVEFAKEFVAYAERRRFEKAIQDAEAKPAN